MKSERKTRDELKIELQREWEIRKRIAGGRGGGCRDEIREKQNLFLRKQVRFLNPSHFPPAATQNTPKPLSPSSIRSGAAEDWKELPKISQPVGDQSGIWSS